VAVEASGHLGVGIPNWAVHAIGLALWLDLAAGCSLDRRGLPATAYGVDGGVQAPGDGARPSDVIATTAIDLRSSIGDLDSLDPVDAGSTTDTRPDVGAGAVDIPGTATGARDAAAPADGERVDGADGHVGDLRPQVISVDFVGAGTPMAPTEVAGVIPAAYWNSAPMTQGSLVTLVAADGHATSSGVAWSTDSLYRLGIPDDPGNNRMMNGYLDPFIFASVTVSGLPDIFTQSGYDVYVYANGAVTTGDTRSGFYRIGGVTQILTQTGNTSFDGMFRLDSVGNGANYVVFHSIAGASFTLFATPGPATTLPRSPLNGLQIVSAATSP
jgi:hypothetical protein